MAWSNLDGEDIALVGDLEDLGPDEATETNAILVDDKTSGADSDVDHLSTCVLPTDIHDTRHLLLFIN